MSIHLKPADLGSEVCVTGMLVGYCNENGNVTMKVHVLTVAKRRPAVGDYVKLEGVIDKIAGYWNSQRVMNDNLKIYNSLSTTRGWQASHIVARGGRCGLCNNNDTQDDA